MQEIVKDVGDVACSCIILKSKEVTKIKRIPSPPPPFKLVVHYS